MFRAISLVLGLAFFVAGSPFGVTTADAAKRPAAKSAKNKKHQKSTKRAAPSRAVASVTHSGLPNVQARSSLVVDLETGEELFAKNADEVRPIASISKLVAMLVVLDRKLDFDGVTVITEDDATLARRGARSRLFTGEGFTNRDLVHAALMASDNRAVPALGRAVGLSVKQLVSEMNRKCKELDLARTHFDDPVGLDQNNVSTTRDLVRVLRAAIKNPIIVEISKKPTYLAKVATGKPRTIEYTNTDQIARGTRYEVLTGKTGYTDVALYCLAIAARIIEGKQVAMVFLGADGKETRFADFRRVAEWLVERKWAGREASASRKL